MQYQIEIKSINANEAIIEGYAVIFGGKDLVGQTFTSQTDFALDLVPNKPILIEHGLEGTDYSVGEVISAVVDNIGIKIQAKLDTSIKTVRDYLDKIKNNRPVGFSSGTAGHLIRSIKNIITQWPIIEVSITTHPAEPRTLGINQIKSFNSELADRLEAAQENRKESTGETTGEKDPTNKNTKGITQMDTENTKALADMLNDAREQAEKDATAKFQAELKSINDAKLAEEAKRQELEAIRADERAKVEAEFKSVKNPGYAFHKLSKPGDSDGNDGDTKSYVAWLRTGDPAIKSLLEATAGSAPQMPIPMVQRIFEKAAEISIVRAAGATVNSTANAQMDFVSVATGTASAVFTAEGGTFTALQDNYAKTTVSLYKAGGYVPVSTESLGDTYFDLEAHLTREISKSIAARENNWFINGNGTNQPYGILTRAGSALTAASTGTITYGEFLQLIGALNPLYANSPKAAFLVKRTVLYSNVLLGNTITNFLTFQNMGVNSGNVGMVPGGFGSVRLQGIPAWDCSEMPAATTGQKVLVYGDISQYQIVQKVDSFRVVRNDFENMASGMVRFYFETRLGGDLPQTEGIKYITLA